MKGGKTMNNLQIFKNGKFGQVRTVTIDGKIYFVAVDIAKALGYARPNDTINQHCRWAVKHRIPHPQNSEKTIEVNVIPEGDIYRLVANSELPGAQEFEGWIFDDVLPQIRQTGGYVNNEDLFINTYLPFADENTKLVFKNTLGMVRKQNEIISIQKSTINKQGKELEHKDDVIVGLVDEISLAEKRQVLNRVVRYKGANFQERWRELYKQFEMKYHIDLSKRFEAYNIDHKPKMKNKIDYIDKAMGKVPELYEIACKIYENDVKELAKNIYSLNEEVM